MSEFIARCQRALVRPPKNILNIDEAQSTFNRTPRNTLEPEVIRKRF